jgi:putative DNA methylase
MRDDTRLIEDYLPIEAISEEATREKSPRKGHISTLHLWWARRPLVACRAAVYGALVSAARFVPDAAGDSKKKSLGRANAAKFVERLCKYPGDHKAIAEAQRHILEAHAERLSHETGKRVTVEDIEAGRSPRPKVLDMFAGGGAIPLEALRLGCEAYALDLNPVAHIIELCTLVYPQKYGQPDPTTRGMSGPKNDKGETTWGGLAEEVRYWGEWVLNKVKAEIGELYPPIPDPDAPAKPLVDEGFFPGMAAAGQFTVPGGYLTPVAYLWTRTVTCKNPACKAIVPLVKQTWLCKKKNRYVALRVVTPKRAKRVRFEVVEAANEKGLNFDPAEFSKGGNATCPFCGTVADADYTQAQGLARKVGFQLMAVVSRQARGSNMIFIAADALTPNGVPDDHIILDRIDSLRKQSGLPLPEETISTLRPSPNARGLSAPTRHGLTRFADLYHPRQLLSLMTQCKAVRAAAAEMKSRGFESERSMAVTTYLGIVVDRMADRGSSLCRWDPAYTKTQSTFGRPALPFVWDFSETNPFGDASGDMNQATDWVCRAIEELAVIPNAAVVHRGSATTLQHEDETFDAVLTDPPYYDNVPYADVSDFFYVWLKRTVGPLYPEHFSSELTPKKSEATALSSRHEGKMEEASRAYEKMMLDSFREANRVLKQGSPLVVVYAHKTTLGWSTLVDALRLAGFTVTEAWPLDTEFGGRLIALDSAALASSIFLVARKREAQACIGNYETEVQPELEAIIRERVDTLWDQGVSGADLVIACVGAGLRAFTRFARVEYANGDEVPAERFLAEVETVVLDSILARLSKEVGGNSGRTSLAGVDPATRFYTLWRYTYRSAELDAGEAIVFANGTHVELDGHNGLSAGARALIEKKKGEYQLRDFAERGEDAHLGMPSGDAQPAPLIDALHRTLWPMENRPGQLVEFLREAQPNREQMRLVAQALAGPALKGGELDDVSPTGETAALRKLTSNWRSVIEDNVFKSSQQADRKSGQQRLFE